MRPRAAALIPVLLVTLAACRHDNDEAKVPMNLSRPPAAVAETPLGPGDIRITSADSGIDLALIGDSISGGLSTFALAKVRRETDTNAVSGNGIGASIEKIVKGSVQSALGTRITLPVASVKDVRYDGQRLVFEWNGKPPEHFGTAKVNNKDVMASFNADDAQRFVVAVRARQRAVNRQP
jgi:hypothetical protein